MNNDSVDLLDLDDGTSVDTLPEVTPFAAPRPRKPWLLLGVGVLVIILATYIIIRTVGGDSSSSMEVDLDAPVTVDANAPATEPINIGGDEMPVNVASPEQAPDTLVVPEGPVQPAAPVEQPVQQAAEVTQPAVSDAPVRVIEDRKNVTFNPEKTTVTASEPAKKVTTQPAAKPAATKKTATKTTASAAGSWYVQFGSYSTRALAESAQRQLRNAHSGLFQGKQFVVLAAQLPNGTTTYRLRIAFASSAEANGFCRNAKSDGLDCYITK